MWKKVSSLILAVLLVAALIPSEAFASDYIAAVHTQNTGSPYYIMVNRPQNCITIYGLDSNGYYSVPVKAIVCSTGANGTQTPTGTYRLGDKHRWAVLMGGVWGQYCSRIYGGVLFHSVCYNSRSPSNLRTDHYNNLGNVASHGCIRLQVADAKWIYENCPTGTYITIYNGTTPGALGKPVRLIPEGMNGRNYNGWEPSDPDPNNPWHMVTMNQTSATLQAGEELTLSPTYSSYLAPELPVSWTSSDPSVATVDDTGKVVAMMEGTTTINVYKGASNGSCEVTVEGSLLPFPDVQPGEWYYLAVKYAWENGILSGTDEGYFLPDTSLTRAQAIQVLYNLAGGVPDTSGRPDWWTPAVEWASGANLLTGMSMSGNNVNKPITRQEFISLLYNYDKTLSTHQDKTASLDEYRDSTSVFGFAENAVGWGVATGIMQGSDGMLNPNQPLTRAEMSSLLMKYKSI